MDQGLTVADPTDVPVHAQRTLLLLDDIAETPHVHDPSVPDESKAASRRRRRAARAAAFSDAPHLLGFRNVSRPDFIIPLDLWFEQRRSRIRAGVRRACDTCWRRYRAKSGEQFCSIACQRADHAQRLARRPDTCLVCSSSRGHIAACRIGIAERTGFCCALCDEPVDLRLRPPHARAATFDHILPVLFGGRRHPENLRLAHKDCNERRGAALPDPAFLLTNPSVIPDDPVELLRVGPMLTPELLLFVRRRHRNYLARRRYRLAKAARATLAAA